jgi:hypothetical protein
MSDFPRVVFDEAHSEAWTLDAATAAQLNRVNPADVSYSEAARALTRSGFEVSSRRDGLLTADAFEGELAGTDVLVIAHPAEPGRERASGTGSPRLAREEIDGVEQWVRGGGGLVVLAECDQEHYGSNLTDLLSRFGVGVHSTTVQEGVRRHNNVASWVMADLGTSAGKGLLAGVRDACFYRAGVLDLSRAAGARVLARTSDTADPAGAPLAAALEVDRGRLVVLADSDLFGDDSIDEFDHRTLWTNLVTWAAGSGEPAARESALGAASANVDLALDPQWLELKQAVSSLRALQGRDGSIDEAEHDHDKARTLVSRMVEGVVALAPRFPHDAAYLEALQGDLLRWADEGFGKPDFLDSLVLFRPDQHRADGVEHLVLFPMYTQNGNPNRQFEALLIRVTWPDWLAKVEAVYDNRMFLPVNFIDFTQGYDSNSAVLFPETVAVREVPVVHWGAIFCDREAARFRRVTAAAAQLLKVALPPDAERLVGSQSLAQSTFAMWDLIHDRTHSHGDLPFDPFMIKQRMPYWMYALEELRCDLNTVRQAVALEQDGHPYARSVQYAIVFDRIFRFTITGERVRNYDGLGGQLLFAYLHRNDVVRWTDNTLTFDWDRLPGCVVDLCEEVEKLYRSGIDRSKVGHWIASYELMSSYVPAHPSSTWAKGPEALPLDGPPKGLTDAVLPDEFPLNVFFEALRKKLGDVVASTSGITSDSDAEAKPTDRGAAV